MKQILILFSVFSFLFLSSFSKTKEEYSLTIVVENLRNSKGVLQVALYNKDGSIPDEQYKNYFDRRPPNRPTAPRPLRRLPAPARAAPARPPAIYPDCGPTGADR